MDKRIQHIERYGVVLRLVEPKDAKFILKLRNDEQRSKHLSKTSNNINDQINWINEYKKREALGEEYYFVAVDEQDNPLGTTRLSELNGASFELGSWLFSKDSPVEVAIKADIITKEIGFDWLNFESCKFNVRKENKKVLNYHKHYSPEFVKEDDLNIFFLLNKENFNKVKDKFIKMLSYGT